jgi:hypothetical protein
LKLPAGDNLTLILQESILEADYADYAVGILDADFADYAVGILDADYADYAVGFLDADFADYAEINSIKNQHQIKKAAGGA